MKIYHIFTNNQDEWTDSLKTAKSIFDHWVKEYGTARLYEEKHINEEIVEEKCLEAFGEYPF